MKTIKLLPLLMVFLAVTAWAQNPKAAAYNNKIIDLQHKLTPKIITFLKVFESPDSFNSLTKDEIVKKKKTLIADFDKSIKKLTSFKGFEGDESLKDAAMKWFVLYKETLDEEYDLLIENYAKKGRTDKDKEQAKKVIEDMHARELEIDQNFEAAQQSFAKKHQLEIKTYPMNASK